MEAPPSDTGAEAEGVAHEAPPTAREESLDEFVRRVGAADGASHELLDKWISTLTANDYDTVASLRSAVTRGDNLEVSNRAYGIFKAAFRDGTEDGKDAAKDDPHALLRVERLLEQQAELIAEQTAASRQNAAAVARLVADRNAASRRLTVRATTDALADELMDAPVCAAEFAALATVEEKWLEKQWNSKTIKGLRARMACVEYEDAKDEDVDDVQTVMTELCEALCNGGHLAHQDTHAGGFEKRLFPDGVGVSVLSGAATIDRVTYASAEYFEEYNCDFAELSQYRAALTQVRDHAINTEAEQPNRTRIFLGVADKSFHRLLCYNIQQQAFYSAMEEKKPPLLTSAPKPTAAFRWLARMLRSTPEQLGRVEPRSVPPQLLARYASPVLERDARTIFKPTVYSVYRGGDAFVVKVYNSAADAAKEATFMQSLAPHLPVTKVEEVVANAVVIRPLGETLASSPYSLGLLERAAEAIGVTCQQLFADGVCHGDPSPSNVIVCEGDVYINDWSEHRAMGECEAFSGTRAYCSPPFAEHFLDFRNTVPYNYGPWDDLCGWLLTLLAFAAVRKDPERLGTLGWEGSGNETLKRAWLANPIWAAIQSDAAPLLSALLDVVWVQQDAVKAVQLLLPANRLGRVMVEAIGGAYSQGRASPRRRLRERPPRQWRTSRRSSAR